MNDQQLVSTLNRITDCCSRWYDIEMQPEEAYPLAAKAAFHETGTGYALIRKAEMWTAEKHEYCYFFLAEELTLQLVEDFLAKTRELGDPLVEPKPGHMCTNLSLVVICKHAAPEALKALKKIRIRKNFRLSLWGWMEVMATAVVLDQKKVYSNFAACRNAAFYKKIVFPKEK